MTITFDLYTHRNKLYRQLIKVAILGFLIAVICLYATNLLESQEVLYGLAVSIIIIYVLFMMAFLFIVGYGMLETYEKDGELILSDDEIIIDGIQILLNTSQKIYFKLRPRTKRSGWRMLGNRVEITDVTGKIYKRLFSINSYEHDDQLFQKLNIWSEKGIKYTLTYTIF